MDLDWLRAEVLKDPKEANWFKVSEVAKKLHDEENLNSSILGLSKGYVNFVKIGYYYQSDKYLNEVKLIYPNVKIHKFASQSALIKVLKGPELSEYIQNELVIFTGDKSTLEPMFGRYKIPYVKFIMGESSKSYTKPDGSRGYQNRFTWRKDGNKGISWAKGDALSMKRDNLLEDILLEVADDE